jgi:hypothetical protein
VAAAKIVAIAALVSLIAGATSASAGELQPDRHEFAPVRVGKTSRSVATFTLRTTTCAEIDPARPDCAGMVFPAVVLLPDINVSGDFRIVRHGCHGFPVASADGSPCKVEVAFAPKRKGLRRGRLETNFGSAALSAKGLPRARGAKKRGK